MVKAEALRRCVRVGRQVDRSTVRGALQGHKATLLIRRIIRVIPPSVLCRRPINSSYWTVKWPTCVYTWLCDSCLQVLVDEACQCSEVATLQPLVYGASKVRQAGVLS